MKKSFNSFVHSFIRLFLLIVHRLYQSRSLVNSAALCHSMDMSRRLATIISRIFDPTWIVPAMLAVAVVWSIANGLRWRFILLLLFLDGLVPFLYFLHLLRTREISDWDTTDRRERYQLYSFTVAVHAVGVILAAVMGKIILAKILFSFWILSVAFTLITFVWKISLHAGVLAAAATFVHYALGPSWAWLWVLLLPVSWARVVMKKHTWLQVVAGTILASVLLLAMFSFLGISPGDIRAPSQENRFL